MKHLDEFLTIHGYKYNNTYSSVKDNIRHYLYTSTFDGVFVQVVFAYNPKKDKIYYGDNKNKVKVILHQNNIKSECLVSPIECKKILIKNKLVKMDIIRDKKLNSILDVY